MGGHFNKKLSNLLKLWARLILPEYIRSNDDEKKLEISHFYTNLTHCLNSNVSIDRKKFIYDITFILLPTKS